MANPRDHAPTPAHRRGYLDPSAPWPLRALMAVYRFLASLKLAVITIASLAATLAYATWFEKLYGFPAVQQYIYKGVPFSILLAFLGINILCAALIRYPWKKRQVGFVITHAGLITLIVGSYYGFQHAVEGQAGAAKGGSFDRFVRTEAPVIRIRPIRGESTDKGGEFEMPFDGGAFDWPEGKFQLISKPADPIKVAVKAYFPSSTTKRVFVPSKDGSPMVKLRPVAKPPGAKDFTDLFKAADQRWFVIPADTMGHLVTRRAGPAKFAFLFADRPEIIADFLDPPKDPGTLGVARLRYDGRDGKPRSFDVRIDDAKPDAPIPLPESDLTATFVAAEAKETSNPTFIRMLGDSELRVVKFKVAKGKGPALEHTGFAGQPMIPPILPTGGSDVPPDPLVRISYFRPPTLGGAGMSGTFGVVEVMGDPRGNLYYRVFGRDTTPDTTQPAAPRAGILRGKPGPLKLDEDVVAFGGNPNLPMTLSFRAEEYLTSGESKDVCVPIEIPPNQQGERPAAALVEMTVGDETKDVWLQKPLDLVPQYEAVQFKSGLYELAYDFERPDLGFSMKMKDHATRFDPGTTQPSWYSSDILLSDEKAGLKEKPIQISMNKPLTHGKFTFYQMRFIPDRDPTTGRETGEVKSVLQVGYDPGRPLKYGGSLLVVIGAFLQFYIMKFKPFGESESDRAASADKARKLLARKAGKAAAKPSKGKKSKTYDDAIL